jgi:hypothetical protein
MVLVSRLAASNGAASWETGFGQDAQPEGSAAGRAMKINRLGLMSSASVQRRPPVANAILALPLARTGLRDYSQGTNKLTNNGFGCLIIAA